MKCVDCWGIYRWLAAVALGLIRLPAAGETDVYLLGVPDYTWYAGCYGTATGNLMGYWDRHGFPNFYTGPTAGGIAPLNNFGANLGIRSMWASKAGFDGRPADQPGHIDDYWRRYVSDGDFSYESTATDPYVLAGRAEHVPDCIGDFIGLSQKKWTNLNSECDGNIDAYSFVYWDPTGNRRVNYQPDTAAGLPGTDIPWGLRLWTRYRGSEAVVFSQLADFNPNTPSGGGFTFEDLKTEINAGYPVLLFLQRYDQLYRPFANTPDAPPMPKANPEIHGVLAYGYGQGDDGSKLVRYRTSFGDGDNVFKRWDSQPWPVFLPARGVISYRPLPKITRLIRDSSGVTVHWEGPASQLYDAVNATVTDLHWYVVEQSHTWNAADFAPVGPATTNRSLTLPDCCGNVAFFRVRLLGPPTP